MNYCDKCGKGVAQDALYCPNCGSKLTFATSQSNRKWRNRNHSKRENDWWGLVTALGFFVIIGLTIAAYPDVLTRAAKYLESFATYGHPVLPPYDLGQVLIYLFNLSGIWGLVAAFLRFLVTSNVSRSARDGVGALFSLYTAYILTRFYGGAIGGWDLVWMWIVGLVVLIIVNALIALFVPRRIPLSAV